MPDCTCDASPDNPVSFPEVAVVVPALNEEESIPLVLGDLPPVSQIIVVDNGSTDRTAEVAQRFGARVVHEPQRGYGAACLKGIAELRCMRRDNQPDVSVIAFLDADYSDHPNELPRLVNPILSGKRDFVIGSRLTGALQHGAMPLQSIFGNKLACFLMRVLFGVRFTDLGPFRAISVGALEQLKMSDTNFGWTVEMQIKAARCRLRTAEVPVSYRPRIGVSKISGTVSGTVQASWKILYLIARYGFSRRTPLNGTAARAGDSGRSAVMAIDGACEVHVQRAHKKASDTETKTPLTQ